MTRKEKQEITTSRVEQLSDYLAFEMENLYKENHNVAQALGHAEMRVREASEKNPSSKSVYDQAKDGAIKLFNKHVESQHRELTHA